MNAAQLTPGERFPATPAIVAEEVRHLEWSRKRLFEQPVDAAWVEALADRPELAEQPGSQIEMLNRAERLGVVENVTAWLEARQLRSRLVHEYMTDSDTFAQDLRLAEVYSRMPIETYLRLRNDATVRLNIPASQLPGHG